MTPAHENDLVLRLPLSGSRLIEASAGTGKTHTLVLLLLRAILVERCDPRELVAVTYTRAAAGELRERTRVALSAAARRAAHPQAALPAHLAAPVDAMIEMAVARNPAITRPALARRLRAAEMGIDALWLGTVHGFCQRLLSDMGPMLGVPAIGDEIDVGDALFQMACADAWRALQGINGDQPALAACFDTPDALAKTLTDIIALPATALVPPEAPDEATLTRLRAEYEAAWCNARLAAENYSVLAALIRDRVAYGISKDKKNGLSDDLLAELPTLLSAFFACPAGTVELDGVLVRLSGAGLAKLQAKKHIEQGVPLPAHPLPPALDHLCRTETTWRTAANVSLMHRLHTDVRARMARLGFEQSRVRYDDLVTRVASLLAGSHGERLQALAQTRWRLALIDEFQDTDSGQHAIFDGLFGDRLIMVGDPKQAIYRFRGGDVYAYRHAAKRADSTDVLVECYRAEPAVIDAVNALFDAGRLKHPPFREPFIGYTPVRSAYDSTRHGILVRNGKPAAGMRLWTVHPEAGDVWSSRDRARDRVVTQVGQAVVELLDPTLGVCRSMAGAVGDISVSAGDIAVLCQTHAECASIAGELRARGIPVSLGVDPDVEAAAGEDMRRLLAAWLMPQDAGRLRALALSGFYGRLLDELPDGSEHSPLSPDELVEFAEQARLAGTGGMSLALMRAVRAGVAAARRMDDGERRIDAWLRLVDRLVIWAGPGQALHALYLQLRRWLAGQMSEHQNGRSPEPDACDSVRVMTIHASKGLEFGVVFAPFLWNQRDGVRARRDAAYPVARFHDDEGQLRVDIGSDARDANLRLADDEEQAEAIRKAYVAITRARHQVHIPVAITQGGWSESPLAHLFPGVDSRTGAGLDAALQALGALAPRSVALVDPPTGEERLRADVPALPMPQPRRLSSPPRDDFRLLSYSRLVRGLGDLPKDYDPSIASLDAVDAVDAAPATGEPAERLRGAAFGTCFHVLMETLDPVAPDAEALARIAASHGFGEPRARSYLQRLVEATWMAALPGGISLRDLPACDRTAEMEFFVPVRTFSASVLGRTLGGYEAYRRPPEHWPSTLTAAAGYLRGYIDLIYRSGGRYYVLDYKTNDLGGEASRYQSAVLSETIRNQDYDLQYLIYLVALQRLLRSRFGDAYDYDRDVGGAVYLFVRGLESGAGIHHDRPPRALIDQLETVFCGGAQ